MSEHAPEDFVTFLRRRDAAGRAFVQGDAAPANLLTSKGAETTFFDPFGGCHRGGDTVCAVFARNATMFASGDYEVELLQAAADDSVGYTVAIQRGHARLAGASEPVELALRVTEIFRCERGEWRLVHRHADPVNR